MRDRESSCSGRFYRWHEQAGHDKFMADVSCQVLDRLFGESRVNEGFWQFKINIFSLKGLTIGSLMHE